MSEESENNHYKENTESSATNPSKHVSITHKDISDFHRKQWSETYGPSHRFIYDETDEYMNFIDWDDIQPEDIIKEIIRLYLRSTDLGEYDDVINRINESIKSDIKNINRLKKQTKTSEFLCRMTCLLDNLGYGIK